MRAIRYRVLGIIFAMGGLLLSSSSVGAITWVDKSNHPVLESSVEFPVSELKTRTDCDKTLISYVKHVGARRAFTDACITEGKSFRLARQFNGNDRYISFGTSGSYYQIGIIDRDRVDLVPGTDRLIVGEYVIHQQNRVLKVYDDAASRFKVRRLKQGFTISSTINHQTSP